MSSRDDIIPLASRRPGPRLAVAAVPTVPTSSPDRARRIPPLAIVFGVAVAALIAGLAIGQWREVDRLRHLPDGVRVAAYQRALKDIEETCAPPPADGPLHEHCLQQAQFLTIFPECDAGCRRLVDPILPHARR